MNFTFFVCGRGGMFRVHKTGCGAIKRDDKQFAFQNSWMRDGANVESAVSADRKDFLEGSGGDQDFSRSDYEACDCCKTSTVNRAKAQRGITIMSSKSKSKSKSKSSSKEEKKHSPKKHISGEKLGAAVKAVLKLVVSKPKHYTKRRIVSKLREEYGSEVVHGAIESLQDKDSIGTHRVEGGKGEKGFYVLIPLHKKAA